MKDIAEITGVSISTVSRVLNNKGKISEEIRRKVLSASETLIFNKGAVIQSIERQQYNIAIVVPGSGEFYNNDPNSSLDVRMLLSEFSSLGHRVQILFYPEGEGDFSLVKKQILTRAFDGVVLSDPLEDMELVEFVISQNIPYVIMNGMFLNQKLFQIDYDNYEGMKKLTSLVLEKKHTKLCILSGPRNHMVNQNRLEGFLDACKESAAKPDYDLIYGDFSLESGYKRTFEYLFEGKRPTCIIAFSDYIAMGAMRAAKEHKLCIPENLSIVGFDDIEISHYTDPPLTTVKRFSQGFANTVAENLTRRINKDSEICYNQTVFKTELIVRESLVEATK
jgi:DNA-binding LacI/PurR family transcriptional regulator